MADLRPDEPAAEQTLTAAEERDALQRLDTRISQMREGLQPKVRSGAAKYNSLTLAWRMVLELVIGCALGAGLGRGLDVILGTEHWMLVIFGALGLAAGVKTMLASAKEVNDQMARLRKPAGGRAVGE